MRRFLFILATTLTIAVSASAREFTTSGIILDFISKTLNQPYTK